MKSGIKHDTEITFKLSSNAVGDSDNEETFPHKLLLTNTQVSKLGQTFVNYSPANIKFLKNHFHKREETTVILGRLLGPF